MPAKDAVVKSDRGSDWGQPERRNESDQTGTEKAPRNGR
jgi:hypothetical protein